VKAALVSGGLCLAIGLGIGALFAGSTPRSTALRAEAMAAPEHAPEAITRDELAAVVRQELARERAAAPRSVAAAAADRPSAAADDVVAAHEALSSEQAEQAEGATSIVGAALARGSWTEADKEALTRQWQGLPGGVKAEIAGRLADAVNRGAMRLDPDDLPL